MTIPRLTPKQEIILLDEHRFKVLVCGRKFGKTELAIEHIFGETLGADRSKEIAYLASTFSEARDIAWARMKQRYRGFVVGEPNESRLEIILKSEKGPFSHLQLKSWEAVEALRGREFDLLVLDEVQNYKNFWLLWHDVLRPTLTPRKGFALFMGTPKGFNHLYDLFNLEAIDSDYKSFHFTTYDNTKEVGGYLDLEEIEKAKRELPEDRFAQEYLADFRKTEGLVYKEFDRTRHIFDDDTKIYDVIETIAGIDFGFTNPTAIPTIVRDYVGNYWVTDEYYKSGQTEPQVAEYIAAMKFNKVYPDPEAPSAIKELRMRGVNVRDVIKNKDSITNGINKVKELLKANKLHIHKRCINTILEFETYSYPEKQDLQNPKEIPIDENNHMMDALRYAIYMQPIEGERPKAYTHIPSDLIRQPQSINSLREQQQPQERKTAYTYIPLGLKR